MVRYYTAGEKAVGTTDIGVSEKLGPWQLQQVKVTWSLIEHLRAETEFREGETP